VMSLMCVMPATMPRANCNPRAMSWVNTAMLLLGILVQGAQAGLNALAAELYPQEIRSTGIGWALGVGRVGSITGPVCGGLMLAAGWVLTEILSAALVPGIIALTAITLLRLDPASKQQPTPSQSVTHH
jgi:MFS transporter, AAHS family, 4-hydroxybenzoate transporter